jgi:hypothetical protein
MGRRNLMLAIKKTGALPTRFHEFQEAYQSQRIRPFTSFTSGLLSYPTSTPLTVQQIVSSLRNGGMPVSAIAEAMRVERKTIYSWIAGVEVRGTHEQRAALVYSLMTGMPGIDIRNVYRFWNTPVAGESLRDLMCDPAINKQRVKSLLNTLLPAARKARDSERKMSQKGTGNPVLDEMPEAGSNR